MIAILSLSLLAVIVLLLGAILYACYRIVRAYERIGPVSVATDPTTGQQQFYVAKNQPKRGKVVDRGEQARIAEREALKPRRSANPLEADTEGVGVVYE